MFEVWAWELYGSAAVVRGMKFGSLEIAKQFAELCKQNDDVNCIQIDENSGTILELRKSNNCWE